MEKSAYDKMKQLLRWSDDNIELKIKTKEDTVVRLGHPSRRPVCPVSRHSRFVRL